MAPKACPECGSRKWRRDGVTGNAVCEDGHVYQDFRSENLVVDPTGITLQKRRMKGAERVNKRKEEGQTNKEYYHGADAEWLKVQAFQLLLRTQVQALSKLWALPAAYEMVVRDLWAYQLAMHHLPPRPSVHSPDGDTDTDVREENTETPKGKQEEDRSDGSPKSDSETDSDVDPGLLNDIENLSDEENHAEGGDNGRKAARKKRSVRISDTLVCLIVGLWVLRYPVLNVDIEHLVNSGTLPYIDFGRTSALPEEMVRRVNRDAMLALCPPRSPSPGFLHTQSHRLARYMQLQHGILIPEINLPPLAWKVISSLGGTPTTYAQTIRLLALIDVNMTLNDTQVNKWTRKRRGRPSSGISVDGEFVDYDKTARYEDVWLPELAVAAAWVVVMKMAYGLDGSLRASSSKTDPLVGLPRGDNWVEELERRLHAGALKGEGKNMDKIDFTAMELGEIDKFLGAAETVLVKNQRIDDPDRQSYAANVFPLHSSQDVAHSSEHNSWEKYHASAIPVMHRLVPADTANRHLPLLPGELIRSYRATDFTGILPMDYETVLSAAAEVIGVRARDVSKVVEVFERRAERGRRGGSRSRSVSRTGSVSSLRRNRRSGV